MERFLFVFLCRVDSFSHEPMRLHGRIVYVLFMMCTGTFIPVFGDAIVSGDVNDVEGRGTCRYGHPMFSVSAIGLVSWKKI